MVWIWLKLGLFRNYTIRLNQHSILSPRCPLNGFHFLKLFPLYFLLRNKIAKLSHVDTDLDNQSNHVPEGSKIKKNRDQDPV